MNEIKGMPWKNIRIVNSSDANVKKYVFENDNAVAESVLYKYPTYQNRTVICCSTQSGCPVGCRFCGAGDYFVRSLTAEEIVSQPTRLIADTGVAAKDMQRLQIMFMSMGEPLLNLQELSIAIRQLYVLYPNAALLISTSAPRANYALVRELSREVPTVGLQFSIHESLDEKRNELIPYKAKLNLSQIAEEGKLWYEATGRNPFFNYCAHEKNSSEEDALRLFQLFDPKIWQATVSVICERDEHIAAANERQRSLAEGFANKLKDHGFHTRMFDPAGQDDIGGGCGQLWFVQSWMKNHPHFSKPSAGNGKEKVHTPCSPMAEKLIQLS